MPRIFTPPDMEFDRTITKILIRNCDWTDEQLQEYVNQLSDANYDIYLYNDSMNDIQWVEGIRAMATKVYDARDISGDVLTWLKELDRVIQ
jgi:hypothetical protein